MMRVRRFQLTVPRRAAREQEPPEDLNHVRETLAMAHARQGYEREAREEFEARVARESGTFGWETFSLLILCSGGLAGAVLGAMSGVTGWAYALGGVAALSLAVTLLRWRSAVRRRRPPGGPGRPDGAASAPDREHYW
jgi:hypothetical protein